MKQYKLSVVIEKDDDGYFAFCPELQGCYSQGENYEEVLKNIEDAIRLHIEDRIEQGEEAVLNCLYTKRVEGSSKVNGWSFS